MRACALHGGPASNGQEGASPILAGHLDLGPGAPPTSRVIAGMVRVQTQWPGAMPASLLQGWQRPGPGLWLCLPQPWSSPVPEELLSFAPGSPSGVHCPSSALWLHCSLE